MANTYDIGDVVRCSGAFTDSGGSYDDPTALMFRFQDPSYNETTYIYNTDAELVKDDTGRYHVDLATDEAGRWFYRYDGTGTNAAAGETYFWIRESEF